MAAARPGSWQVSPSPDPGRDLPPLAGAVGRIISVNPGSQLTGIIMGAFMSYVLVPQEEGGTRLLLKIIMQPRRLTALALSVGDLVMARRQLLNLKELAERDS